MRYWEDDRANEKPHDAERFHTAQQSEEDEQRVQLSPFAYQVGPDQAVYLRDAPLLPSPTRFALSTNVRR